MSYMSLARKYRPRRFSDMVGQEATTLALTNAIRLRREPHSVIFTGVRGVGKTTSARIYAKALNCEQGPTPEPCDECGSCLAISMGNHEDVLEIDGASNTGVDDVRALQETLGYVPQRSTYKIYIIDEVHMLSISAFNALLKTLEEPPKHVIFIFATTELHKVPETIQSRCQTFHLQKISRPIIAERIRTILHAEQIAFEEAAIALVAREGRGSLRDALTMLDQAIAVGGGQVSLEGLKHMVGGSQSLPVLELLEGLLRKDAAQILEVIARWDQEGLSMSGLAEETAKACRNAFILKDLKGQAIDLQILELEDREQQTLLDLASKAAPMDLNRLFRQLAKCLDDLRHADLDRFVLENYCLEWCFDPGLPDLQSMMGILSGQTSQPVVRGPVAQAPTESAPTMNLRDRWKTTAPQQSAAKPISQPPAQNPAQPTQHQNPVPRTGASLSNPWSSDAPPPARASAPPNPTRDHESAPIQPSPPMMQNLLRMAESNSLLGGQPSIQHSVRMTELPEQQAQSVVSMQEPVPMQPSLQKSSTNLSSPTPIQPPTPMNEPVVRQTDMAEKSSQQHAFPQAKPPAPQNSLLESLAGVHTVPKPAFQSIADPVQSMETRAQPSTPQSMRKSESVASIATPTRDRQDLDEHLALHAEAAVQPDLGSAPPPTLRQKAAPGSEAAPPLSPLQRMRAAASAVDAKANTVLQELLATPSAEDKPAPNKKIIFPATWREFVDEWKKQKPLQGRVLEEAYVMEYTRQRIQLAVEPQSMAGGKLLQQEVRKRLLEQFILLFGFEGQLEVIPKGESSGQRSVQESFANPLGETLLEAKNREREVAREDLKHRLEDHPMTREVISRFGGTIEQIELQ